MSYFNANEMRACQRCGIRRRVKPDRGAPDLCIDCRMVESDLAKSACGTVAGYYTHRRRGQVPCSDCCQARRERKAARKGAPVRKRYRKAEHGSRSGYYAHYRGYNGWTMPACAECLAAYREYTNTLRARKKAA